jgi:hypothetical protein
METEPKIQGKTIQNCLDSLRVFSDKYGVEYKSTFGLNCKEYTVKPRICKPNSKPIYLSFMWRHNYGEYDNSI